MDFCVSETLVGRTEAAPGESPTVRYVVCFYLISPGLGRAGYLGCSNTNLAELASQVRLRVCLTKQTKLGLVCWREHPEHKHHVRMSSYQAASSDKNLVKNQLSTVTRGTTVLLRVSGF